MGLAAVDRHRCADQLTPHGEGRAQGWMVARWGAHGHGGNGAAQGGCCAEEGARTGAMDRSWRGCCLLEEEEGEEEWRHGCWRRRAGKGPALEEADDAEEDEQPEQAGASSRRSWPRHPWLLAEQRHRPWGLLAAMEQKGALGRG
jgi:hypothetical protein